MKKTYDKKADAAYVKFSDVKVDHSVEVRPGIIIDYDKSEHVIGVEVLYVSRQTALKPKSVISLKRKPAALAKSAR